jgi:hypothetical protein
LEKNGFEFRRLRPIETLWAGGSEFFRSTTEIDAPRSALSARRNGQVSV